MSLVPLLKVSAIGLVVHFFKHKYTLVETILLLLTSLALAKNVQNRPYSSTQIRLPLAV
jgi:hypothetical protein